MQYRTFDEAMQQVTRELDGMTPTFEGFRASWGTGLLGPKQIIRAGFLVPLWRWYLVLHLTHTFTPQEQAWLTNAVTCEHLAGQKYAAAYAFFGVGRSIMAHNYFAALYRKAYDPHAQMSNTLPHRYTEGINQARLHGLCDYYNPKYCTHARLLRVMEAVRNMDESKRHSAALFKLEPFVERLTELPPPYIY